MDKGLQLDALKKGESIISTSRPLLSKWSQDLRASKKNITNLPQIFFDNYTLQQILRGLFEGGRGQDILLKGATSWSAWTGQSGLPLFAAQIAATVNTDLVEIGLQDVAISSRPTKDIDFQISGWAHPQEFVDYFHQIVTSETFRNETGILVDVDNAHIEFRKNVAGVGVAMHGQAWIGTSRQGWKIEAFMTPFPEPGIGTMEATIEPMMGSVIEKNIVNRMVSAHMDDDMIHHWLTMGGHQAAKIHGLMSHYHDAGNKKEEQWLRVNVIEKWGSLITPIKVQVVTPEYMFSEKMTANYSNGPLSGLNNIRHKDYYDANLLFRLLSDTDFRKQFAPAFSPGFVFSPQKYQECLKHCFKVRGFGDPPSTASGFAGISDAFADVVINSKTNEDVFTQISEGFLKRSGKRKPERLTDILPFIRDHVDGLGLLPGNVPGPDMDLSPTPTEYPGPSPSP